MEISLSDLVCFCLLLVTQHGGGHVFKTLQWLVRSLDTEKISVGAIIAEDKIRASRHLRHCASEHKIPMMVSAYCYDSKLDRSATKSFEIREFPARERNNLFWFPSTFISPSTLISASISERYGFILMQSASWIINSLHVGKLLPFTDNHSPTFSTVKVPEIWVSIEFSEEI